MKRNVYIRHLLYIRQLFLLLICLFVSVGSFSQNESNEYNIKAMFVLNFMKYIEWPDDANKDIFKIGVVGESDIFGALVNMSNNRHENKKIKIERTDINSTENYQILIIPRSENKKTEAFEKKFQGKGVLIISEECRSNSCGAINLVNIDNKIRFEIYNNQAKLEGIRISSRLSDLAITVHP